MRALSSTVGRDLLTLFGHVEHREGREALLEDLLRAHSPEHVEAVKAACALAQTREGIVAIDPDTKVSSASWEAALGSAGSAIEASAEVAGGGLGTAFVAARPPGHHATPDRAMGFCLFNNVAVAARWLQAHGYAERVLVVDWDVHHGNGTQDAFYRDPSVFYLSLHQAPHYPGTGAAEHTGEGAGVGSTLNVPLPAGTSRERYRRAFSEALDRVADRFTPDFVLISAGFDAMACDPLGDLLLEAEDFHAMTAEVMALASHTCGGRVVAVLEGGYDPAGLGRGVVSVIRALAGLDPPD